MLYCRFTFYAFNPVSLEALTDLTLATFLEAESLAKVLLNAIKTDERVEVQTAALGHLSVLFEKLPSFTIPPEPLLEVCKVPRTFVDLAGHLRTGVSTGSA